MYSSWLRNENYNYISVTFKASMWAHEYLLCVLDCIKYFKLIFQGINGVYYIERLALNIQVQRIMYIDMCACLCECVHACVPYGILLIILQEVIYMLNQISSSFWSIQLLIMPTCVAVVSPVCLLIYTCSNSGNLTPTICLLKQLNC